MKNKIEQYIPTEIHVGYENLVNQTINIRVNPSTKLNIEVRNKDAFGKQIVNGFPIDTSESHAMVFDNSKSITDIVKNMTLEDKILQNINGWTHILILHWKIMVLLIVHILMISHHHMGFGVVKMIGGVYTFLIQMYMIMVMRTSLHSVYGSILIHVQWMVKMVSFLSSIPLKKLLDLN